MSRRPAELDDLDHRHVADMTRADRIMSAIRETLHRAELRCAMCREFPHRCRCPQADGFPGDDGPEAL